MQPSDGPRPLDLQRPVTTDCRRELRRVVQPDAILLLSDRDMVTGTARPAFFVSSGTPSTVRGARCGRAVPRTASLPLAHQRRVAVVARDLVIDVLDER